MTGNKRKRQSEIQNEHSKNHHEYKKFKVKSPKDHTWTIILSVLFSTLNQFLLYPLHEIVKNIREVWLIFQHIRRDLTNIGYCMKNKNVISRPNCIKHVFIFLKIYTIFLWLPTNLFYIKIMYQGVNLMILLTRNVAMTNL